MASFGFNGNGELQFYSSYAIKGISTMTDVYLNIEKTNKLLKLKNKQWARNVYNLESRNAVMKRIFYDFLLLVLDELTKGGMLVFPGKTNANIALKPINDDIVKRAIRNGTLENIDLIKTKYRVPGFVFDFGPKSQRKDRFILVPKRIREKAFRNAENGITKYRYYRKMIE